MKYIKFLLFAMLLFPVKQYAQRKLFNGNEEYLTYVVNETGFDRQKIVILNKENFYALGDEAVDNELFTFYGVVSNAELISAVQLEDKSCWGQFLYLCKNLKYGNANIQNKKIADIPYLKDIKFNTEKKTVIFIYDSSMGKKIIKNFINPILDDLKGDPSYDYIVIGMDTNNIK